MSKAKKEDVKAARAAKLGVAKRLSLKDKGAQRITIGNEHFVFENGKLIEYEWVLPPEYMDFPDTRDHTKETSR